MIYYAISVAEQRSIMVGIDNVFTNGCRVNEISILFSPVSFFSRMIFSLCEKKSEILGDDEGSPTYYCRSVSSVLLVTRSLNNDSWLYPENDCISGKLAISRSNNLSVE